jgi:nucleotide-binding universal stress UspA family protein
MIKNILVPTDGSPFSHQAIAPAIDLAVRARARVHVVRVHERVWTGSYGVEPSTFDPYTDAAVRREEEESLTELADECERRWSVRPCATLLDAPVIGALDGYVRSRDIDLVIMTTHGRGGLSRLLLGSVADALIRTAEVPLLLIRPREDLTHAPLQFRARHILVPLDGSPLAEASIGPAVDFGKLIGARFTLLRVVPPLPGVAATMYAPRIRRQRREPTELQPDVYLEPIAADMRSHGVTVDVAVFVHVNAAEGILDYAATHAVDTIAMATHGRGGWYRLILGSVAGTVMRNVMMPVMLYHPAAGDVTMSGG